MNKQIENQDFVSKELEEKQAAELQRQREEAEEKEEAARIAREELEEKLKNQVECPKCKHKFTIEKG